MGMHYYLGMTPKWDEPDATARAFAGEESEDDKSVRTQRSKLLLKGLGGSSAMHNHCTEEFAYEASGSCD